MMFLHSLCPKIFSKLPHGRVICVLHKIVNCSTITQVESKQNPLSNLRGIVEAFGALEDNGPKNNHPFIVSLPSTEPVKFYTQDSHKYLSDFPGRCVITLGRKTKKSPPHLPLNVFRYSSIQVVSSILVHPILVDTI